MAESSSFRLLDERIQRWIWNEGWAELRDVQEQAIACIVDGDQDVIVSAATAAGKTEAAFLPILTNLLKTPDEISLVIYISPLKALINDQFGRLESLCELLEIPVWPWHGDVSGALKAKFLKRPSGVLLITPESLEATLCNRGFRLRQIFGALRFIVVDELHAFIGSERGKQLQSLMHRIDDSIGRCVPRIALSATLGDMRLAAEFLRAGHGEQVRLLESRGADTELKILLKGYQEALVLPLGKSSSGEPEENVEDQEKDVAIDTAIAGTLFKVLRGSNNLVFPNSRGLVEKYTYLLRRMSEEAHVPNEFWPHHGSLSKELRSETEAALKAHDRPATAICTNTLELGIDIGAIKSVAQIGPPPSVASLRQRLGRSGRRKGEPAILRGYCVEQEVSAKSHVLTRLRIGTIEFIAIVTLLLEGWFEPPKATGAHLSTLVQQLLSTIAERGGVFPNVAYNLLCKTGPFQNISVDDFQSLLRSLAGHELIQQESSGSLLLGTTGEKMVAHYSFYSAFATEEEYRILAGGTVLGSIPISSTVRPGDLILFGGKTWRVTEIDEAAKSVQVTRQIGGKPPRFGGGAGAAHDRVRARMREIYEGFPVPPFLDKTAQGFLAEGRQTYQSLSLGKECILATGGHCLIFTWLGDHANDALALMLKQAGLSPVSSGPALELYGMDGLEAEDIRARLYDLATEAAPSVSTLLAGAKNLAREKWDLALPEELLERSYASTRLDISSAYGWLGRFSDVMRR